MAPQGCAENMAKRRVSFNLLCKSLEEDDLLPIQWLKSNIFFQWLGSVAEPSGIALIEHLQMDHFLWIFPYRKSSQWFHRLWYEAMIGAAEWLEKSLWLGHARDNSRMDSSSHGPAASVLGRSDPRPSSLEWHPQVKWFNMRISWRNNLDAPEKSSKHRKIPSKNWGRWR